MKKPIVFYTIVDDEYFYQAGTHVLINSFKKYHPDIPLMVYRQDMIDKVFKEKGINFYNAKPTFAKLLVGEYEKVVNIDADTVITGRLEPILGGDWEVGGVWNYNHFENASFDNITEKMYVQAGLVGSTNPKFWDEWEEANKDAEKYIRKENDTLNLVWYNNPIVKEMKKVIWDKEKDYMGCKSLALEGRMYLEDGQLMLDNEKVLAYHHAKGKDFPKLRFSVMGFTADVVEHLYKVAMQGNSILIK